MITPPAVSIIMPAYNAAATIAEAIETVLAQSYPDWELLICDDASRDNTVAVVSPYLADARIRLIQLPTNSGGAGRPRNQAIAQAAGRWLAFLDADDLWLPAKLEKQIDYLQTHPGVTLVHCCFQLLQNGKLVRSRYLPTRQCEVEGDLSQRIIWRNPVATPAVVLERAVLDKVGRFDETLFMVEDHDLWIRLAQYGPFGYLYEPLLVVRTHAGAGTFRSLENLQRVEESMLEVSRRYAQNNAAIRHKSLARVNGIMGMIYLENGHKPMARAKFKAALPHALAVFDPYALLILKFLMQIGL